MKTRRPLARALAAAALASAAAAPALAQQPFTPEQVKLGQELMQKQMATMTPELVERARALSPEIKQFLMKVALRHERRSDTLTLRQVMHDILADYQAVGAAIAVDNGAAAADAARRIAGHRLPRGGMLPYLPLDKVSDDGLSVLPAMEAAVEGGARQQRTHAVVVLGALEPADRSDGTRSMALHHMFDRALGLGVGRKRIGQVEPQLVPMAGDGAGGEVDVEVETADVLRRRARLGDDHAIDEAGPP